MKIKHQAFPPENPRVVGWQHPFLPQAMPSFKLTQARKRLLFWELWNLLQVPCKYYVTMVLSHPLLPVSWEKLLHHYSPKGKASCEQAWGWMEIHKPVNTLYKPIKEMSFNFEMGFIKDWEICCFRINAILLGLNKSRTCSFSKEPTWKNLVQNGPHTWQKMFYNERIWNYLDCPCGGQGC